MFGSFVWCCRNNVGDGLEAALIASGRIPENEQELVVHS